MGTGAMIPLDDRALEQVTARTLVVAGAEDDKFAAIGRALAGAVPDAVFEAVVDAGHAAHLEQPAATAELIVPLSSFVLGAS